MSPSPILKFPTLLKPISKRLPVGNDLRKNDNVALYRQIKDARTSARNIERQQNQSAEKNLKANWKVVYELGCEILTLHSKDLEIAAWLIEALLREYEFAGLRDGFHLTRELIESYGNALYPLPDEDGVMTQITPLIGLNGEASDGTLIIPLSIIPLTQGKSVGPFSLWQYQQALDVLKISDPEKRAQRLASEVATLETITMAINETPSSFLQTRLTDLESCISEFKQLNTILDQHYGINAPPFSRIAARLDASVEFIKIFSKEKRENIFAPEKNELIIDVAIEEKNKERCEFDSNSRSRQEVLQSLLNAANYFRQTEPHSPLSYLLEKAVRWGRMLLPDLLQEMVQDEQAREKVFILMGIKK